MTSKIIGTAGLVGAFVAGLVVATAVGGGLGGGMLAWGAKAPATTNASMTSTSVETPELRASAEKFMEAMTQGQQVIVQQVINPTITEADITLLRQDLRAKKMQVIGQNMSMSDGEAQKFWPIYNHYVKDLQVVNNQKYALLKQYAEMWETMSDGDALIYVRHWLEADGEAQALRLKYVPVVSQVLPGRKAATFFQLDRRLNMIIDLQLFSQIPLAHPKE
jgi:hypothetical protein